ncbi:MAG: hypothetical protein OQK24_10685 [Magnetovibrio sp.]|nr:hypothetical protein [Magnetovibrio sp.]
MRRYDVEALGALINDQDMLGCYLNCVQDALGIIAETGALNVALQFDLYHVQIM